jgi:hypothetical protein
VLLIIGVVGFYVYCKVLSLEYRFFGNICGFIGPREKWFRATGLDGSRN